MRYYKPIEIADKLNLTTQTLMLWRKKGKGPKWIKLGQNIVRYPIDDFNLWIKSSNFAGFGNNYEKKIKTKDKIRVIAKELFGERWIVPLANYLGITRQAVYLWLANKRNIPQVVLIALEQKKQLDKFQIYEK